MAAVVVAAAALVVCVALSAACEVFARDVLRSTWVVYYLIGDHGRVLYVGQTNDHVRRYREHIDPAEPGKWRREVNNLAVVKHCWSQRQSKRVERRMIRALWDGHRWRMCPPIWNVALARRGGVFSVSRFCWLIAYRLNGAIWPVARFHAPSPAFRRPDGENAVHGDVNTDSVWGTGTTRRETPSADPVSTADSPREAPLGALPPPDMSAGADPAADTPPNGTGRPPLRVLPPPADEAQTETPAERRRRQNREAQQRRRARDRERKASSR